MTAWIIVASLVVSISTYAAGNYLGYARGQADAQATQAKQDVDTLTKAMQTTNDAIAASNKASIDMRNLLGQIEKSGQTSTKELKNALAKNHADPVICKFDADSMRIIAEARARAADRAAGGIRETVPAASGSDR